MQKIHFVGLGGTGLSAIAKLLLERGFAVSGSDLHDSTLLRGLQSLGAQTFVGHNAENIAGADVIIQSSAVPPTNPELVAARHAGLPVYKRAEYLPQLLAGKYVVAVAGTHGKTTTTAMIAWIFTSAGNDPSYIIGSVSRNLASNAHAGYGKYFVIEADEYDGMFLGIHPHLALVTTIEHDHPDCYPTPQSYLLAFERFVSQIQAGGSLLIAGESQAADELALKAEACVLTFGSSENDDYRFNEAIPNDQAGYNFSMTTASETVTVKLAVPGLHNVFNACAAMAACHILGISLGRSAEALASFSGTARRFELAGRVNGALLFDDYAHHPSEIAATIQAARTAYPDRRLRVVWQPHTYSRTSTLLDDYAQVFDLADEVLVTAIYAARESDDGTTYSHLQRKLSGPAVRYIPELSDMAHLLKDTLQPNDLVLVLSAGTAIEINQTLLALAGEEARHAA